MKQTEIKPCAACGKGVMHAGAPQFYQVTVQPYLVNVPAIQRQHGLEQMLGGNATTHVAAAFSMIGPCRLASR